MKTFILPARSTTATDTRAPHSAHAASAIVIAILAETSRCISTCALTEPGTTRTVATPAAANTRNIMRSSHCVTYPNSTYGQRCGYDRWPGLCHGPRGLITGLKPSEAIRRSVALTSRRDRTDSAFGTFVSCSVVPGGADLDQRDC